MKAAIITIGDELTQGFTLDSNGSWLSRYLTDNNIEVKSRFCIPDNRKAIFDTLNQLDNSYNLSYIIITGGLGPTHDDITKNVLSDYFKLPLILEENYLIEIKEKFKKNNLQLPSDINSQALILNKSIPIKNKFGTALGLIIKKNELKVIVLPGVPSEMKQMMKGCNIFRNKYKSSYITLSTIGIYESRLYDLLKKAIRENKNRFKLSFLPTYSGVNIRISSITPMLDNIELIKFKLDVYKIIGIYI